MNDDDEFDDLPEDDEGIEGASVEEETVVLCPYCGEMIEVALDAGGGAVQEYVEDCSVCCRPMRIKVRYARDGSASVTADAEDEEDLEG